MPSIFDPESERRVRSRVDALRADSAALWGQMNAHRMVCHLLDSLRVASGEAPVKAGTGPLSVYPVRWLFVYTLPWPKGKIPTSPEFQQTSPADWSADVTRLTTLLATFAARGRTPGATLGPHPAFGNISRKEWGRLVLMHFDHHLRQFGV